MSQLDHHLEQIRIILAEINSSQSDSSPADRAPVVAPPPLIDANSWMQQQQQQQHMMITASLLACQQQLQMQQNEMRQLQQIILQVSERDVLFDARVCYRPLPLYS